MWAQIIFFLAVAFFIILIVRRIPAAGSESSSGFTRVLDGLTKALRTTGIWMAMVMGKLISRKPRPKKATFVSAQDPISDHAFWQEEATQKQEITSNLEEGEQLMKAGKFLEAEQFLIKAATNNPGNARVYARLGLLYLQQKNYSDAIEALSVAVKLEPHNPSRHYNLALAYSGNKDTRRAIKSVRDAIDLDPVTKKYRQLLEQLLNG